MRWTRPPAKKAGTVDGNRALAAIARNGKKACFGDCGSCGDAVNCRIAKPARKIKVMMMKEPVVLISVKVV